MNADLAHNCCMLRIENLSKSYGSENIFRDLSFQLTKGERCSLVGRNGCGKSTLLKILIGIETADEGQIIKPNHYRVGYLQQHIKFTRPTLRQEAALALPEEERETPYKVEAILSGLGFKEPDFELPPESFSGGYQLRILLAKTLAEEPDCLLLDEPTNYLDIVSITWLERFLRNWRGEMILISHDRAFLDAISTHTMGIHRKQLFRIQGQSPDYYNHLIQSEDVHEKTRLKIEKKKDHSESFIKRFGAKATKAKQAQSRQKSIDKLPSLEKLAQLQDLDFHFQSAPFPGRMMLEAKDLCFKYKGMNDLLIKDFTLNIEPGDRLAIIGKNGRGKSTLLKLLAGELSAEAGSIKKSENLSIGYFGQTNVAKLNAESSIEEEIALSNPLLAFSEVKRICGMMMFPQKQSEKKIKVLSGGEKSRVLLGKILAKECNLLLLDEPTNHLDVESIEALLEALEDFPGSVILVTHGEEMLRRIPDKLVICHENNQQRFEGDYSYFLEKQGWEDAPEKQKTVVKENRKELKKQRAEKVQARSKALAPLKKKIQILEKKIEKLDSVLSELHLRLEKEPDTVAETSRLIGEEQKKSDALYAELEQLYEEYEKRSAEMD